MSKSSLSIKQIQQYLMPVNSFYFLFIIDYQTVDFYA